MPVKSVFHLKFQSKFVLDLSEIFVRKILDVPNTLLAHCHFSFLICENYSKVCVFFSFDYLCE